MDHQDFESSQNSFNCDIGNVNNTAMENVDSDTNDSLRQLICDEILNAAKKQSGSLDLERDLNVPANLSLQSLVR